MEDVVQRRDVQASCGVERQFGREFAGVLRGRAHLLRAEETLLAELVLDRGNSFEQIAHLMRLSEGTVRRRFSKIVRRLSSRETLVILRSGQLSHQQECVARAYYLKGMSQEAIARETASTPYFIKKTLKAVRAMARKRSEIRVSKQETKSDEAHVTNATLDPGQS